MNIAKAIIGICGYVVPLGFVLSGVSFLQAFGGAVMLTTSALLVGFYLQKPKQSANKQLLALAGLKAKEMNKQVGLLGELVDDIAELMQKKEGGETHEKDINVGDATCSSSPAVSIS